LPHPLPVQFIRYVVVGGIAFIVDFSSLYMLTAHFGWHYLASATVAFLLGLATNYALCIAWIFDFHAIPNRSHEFIIFCSIGVVGLGLNNALLYVLTEYGHIHYLGSKAISAISILAFNFTMRRTILFS